MKPICTFIISNQFFYAFARWSSFMLWQRFLSDVFLWIHILFRSVPVFQCSPVCVQNVQNVCTICSQWCVQCVQTSPYHLHRSAASCRVQGRSGWPLTIIITTNTIPHTGAYQHQSIPYNICVSCSTTQYANIITGNTSNDIRNAIFGTIPIFKWSGQWSVYQHKMMIKTTPETSRLMYMSFVRDTMSSCLNV